MKKRFLEKLKVAINLRTQGKNQTEKAKLFDLEKETYKNFFAGKADINSETLLNMLRFVDSPQTDFNWLLFGKETENADLLRSENQRLKTQLKELQNINKRLVNLRIGIAGEIEYFSQN